MYSQVAIPERMRELKRNQADEYQRRKDMQQREKGLLRERRIQRDQLW